MQSDNLPEQEEKRIQPSSPSAFTIGRTVGILLLFQLAAALTLPFILSKPITFGSPTFPYHCGIAFISYSISCASLFCRLSPYRLLWYHGLSGIPAL